MARCSRWMRARARRSGTRRCWTTRPACTRPPARSSPMARCSPVAAASRWSARVRTTASSPRTMRQRAASCGARAPFPGPANPATRPGAMCPMPSASMSGAWMPPSYDPELNLLYIGTSVTSPAPKYLLGGNDKQHLYHNSTLALDPAHRQDRVVLPAPRRSLGSRSSLRTHPGRYRGRARSGTPWRGSTRTSTPASATRSSPAFRARPASSTRSIGAPASSCGRGPPSSRTWCESIDGTTGEVTVAPDVTVPGEGRRGADLPERHRRQELARRRLQPAHGHHVFSVAEHLRGVSR